MGEAASVQEARALIERELPELVFLDVQMPDGSGFDVLSSLEEAPAVIFTTAFDSHAMQAFQVNALDYLLKPVEPARLAAALQKPRTRAPQGEGPLARDSKIFIKDGERCWFVKLESIMLFESEGNYARVHFDGQRPLLLRSLNQLEQRLDLALFVRASRRTIVNLDFVASVQPSAAGGLVLQLPGGLLVEMSRRRAAEFKLLTRL